MTTRTFTRTVVTERRIENGRVVEVKTTVTSEGDPEVEKQFERIDGWIDEWNSLLERFPFR